MNYNDSQTGQKLVLAYKIFSWIFLQLWRINPFSGEHELFVYLSPKKNAVPFQFLLHLEQSTIWVNACRLKVSFGIKTLYTANTKPPILLKSPWVSSQIAENRLSDVKITIGHTFACTTTGYKCQQRDHEGRKKLDYADPNKSWLWFPLSWNCVHYTVKQKLSCSYRLLSLSPSATFHIRNCNYAWIR